MMDTAVVQDKNAAMRRVGIHQWDLEILHAVSVIRKANYSF